MAMLEAFVFDPLITWRLLPAHNRTRSSGSHVHNQPMMMDMNFAYMSPLQSHFSAQPPARHGDAQVEAPARKPSKANVDAEAEANSSSSSRAPNLPTETTSPSGGKIAPTTTEQQQQAAMIPGNTKELVVDERRLPEPLHQHFVFDETAEAERDPHMASVRGKQARQRELRQNFGPEGVHAEPDLLSATARKVISRVYAKLNGTDFRGGRESLDVEAQVERLLQEATSHENLCQCYVGWCPFW